MGNDYFAILTIFALVTAASGAHLPEHVPAEAPWFIRRGADENVTCTLTQKCTLTCPFEGEVEKAFWTRQDKPMIPIVQYPPPAQWHQHHDYKKISSMSLQQPGGGAVLEIDGVQLKHRGVHRCSVTSSTGNDTDRFIDLRVHEDGLFTVSSSVKIPANSPAVNYTCNISTAYSWKNETITLRPPDRAKLNYLWFLLILFALPLSLLICCRKKLPKVKKLWKKKNTTSQKEGPDSFEPLNSEGNTSAQQPCEDPQSQETPV